MKMPRAKRPAKKRNEDQPVLEKCPTGIPGLDDISGGGLPKGRPTLICGSAGCGKTLMGVQFLIEGAVRYGEPGVVISFEETADDMAKNTASLGHNLNGLADQGKLVLDHVRVERSEIEETGEYDLEGLFIRLNHAIDSVGAKRVLLDTIEALFSGLTNTAILRAELRRLFQWLKDKGVTAVITGERGEGTLTRQGLEEYISDCVILLDHRVEGQVSTRRLRIVKYRGTTHGTNEYPFLIEEDGIHVMPITSVGLAHDVSNERISTGVQELDEMMGGKGYIRGTTVLVSGTAGAGKSSMAAHFANAACRRGERCIYFAFEESPRQIMRNMRSIGLKLDQWVRKGNLVFHASRPMLYGPEMHLAKIHKLVREHDPDVVVLDPISNLVTAGSIEQATTMLLRLVDLLKSKQITALLTDLTSGGSALESTDVGISSIVDTWLLLRDVEYGGERNRAMYILKSRGMSHSNQLREFLITDKGLDLLPVYHGPEGVLTGTARAAQEAREKAQQLLRQQQIETKRREMKRRREALEQQIATMRAQLEAEEEEAMRAITQDQAREEQLRRDRAVMAQLRHDVAADAAQQPEGNGRNSRRG
jgi:circadian clock protein KaiC